MAATQKYLMNKWMNDQPLDQPLSGNDSDSEGRKAWVSLVFSAKMTFGTPRQWSMSFPIRKCPGCRASPLCHLLVPAHMHIHTGPQELEKSHFWLGMCLGDCPCTIYMVVFILMNEESLIGSEWRILNWRMTGSDLYFRRIMATIWIIDGWGGRRGGGGWTQGQKQGGGCRAVQVGEGMSNSFALSPPTAGL